MYKVFFKNNEQIINIYIYACITYLKKIFNKLRITILAFT